MLDMKDNRKNSTHRYPFLLVDKILDLDLEKGHDHRAKNVTINEAFFKAIFLMRHYARRVDT